MIKQITDDYGDTLDVEFSDDEETLVRFPQEYRGKFVIPNSVIVIGDFAFFGCSGLTSIIIPNTVNSIGWAAFEFCHRLTAITIPNSVMEIGAYAFSDCIGLTSVVLSNSVLSIRDNLFAGCSSLTSVKIPSSVRKIEGQSFCACSAIASISIPATVTMIGWRAFAYCCGLTTITIPFSVMEIKANAFENCKQLREVKIYNSDCKIAENVFQDCSPSLRVLWPEDMKEEEKKRQELQQRRENYEQEMIRVQSLQQAQQNSLLFFDTETTGLPRSYSAPCSNVGNWPRLVQLGWIVTTPDGQIIKSCNHIIYPQGFIIPSNPPLIHSITTDIAKEKGTPILDVLRDFFDDLVLAQTIIGHNVDFDKHIVGAELYRQSMDYDTLMNKAYVDTMLASTNFCQIPSSSDSEQYKWPTLQELYTKLFGRQFTNSHDAMADITATMKCFFELKKRDII